MAYHNPYISGSFIAKAFFVAHVYGSLKFPFGRLDDFFQIAFALFSWASYLVDLWMVHPKITPFPTS